MEDFYRYIHELAREYNFEGYLAIGDIGDDPDDTYDFECIIDKEITYISIVSDITFRLFNKLYDGIDDFYDEEIKYIPAELSLDIMSIVPYRRDIMKTYESIIKYGRIDMLNDIDRDPVFLFRLLGLSLDHNMIKIANHIIGIINELDFENDWDGIHYPMLRWVFTHEKIMEYLAYVACKAYISTLYPTPEYLLYRYLCF